MANSIFRRILNLISLPVLLMAALLLSGAIVFVLFFNQSTERERVDFVEYSEALVASFFTQMQTELVSLAKDYAHGDDIAEHMLLHQTSDHHTHDKKDGSWFRQYVNSAVYSSLRIDYFAILLPDGTPAHAIYQGKQEKIANLNGWDPALNTLVSEQIKDANFRAGRGVLKIGEHYYFAVIEAIQPIDKGKFPGQTRFGYMLLMRPFSAIGLQDSMKELVVTNLRISHHVQKMPGEGIYPLIGLDGRPAAYLEWHVNFPSMELQNLLRPKILFTLFILAILVVLVTVYMRMIQNNLQRAKSRMTRHSEALQKLVNYKATLEGQEQAFLRMVTECIAQVVRGEKVAINWFDQKVSKLGCLDQYLANQRLHSQEYYSTVSEQYTNWLQAQAAYRHSNSRIHYFSAHQISIGILLHGELVGVLIVFKPSIPLEQDERSFLCSVADLIALTMETSSRIRAEAALHKSEYFDATTGLPNRLSFVQFLHKQVDNNQPFAIVAVGLAGLRAMHDDLGHQQTEVLLGNLAENLRAYRVNEAALARLDAYRFALCWQPEHTDSITQEVQSMQHALSAPIAVGEHLIHPKVRVGVSLFPHDAAQADSLLQCAEFALGRAQKNTAEPLLFFDEKLNQQVKAYYYLEQAMREDIGTEAFSVMLQPLVNLKTEKVVGAEALLRWHRPGHDPISPVEFIPLAEESGLIHILWQQVLVEVLKFLVRWRDQLPEHFVIAVNVSAVQLKQVGFIDYLIETLAEYKVLANRLEIELTESVSLDLYHHAPEMLHALRETGLRIVVDDFGTGYSSLSYLHDLQVDKLKIDKKFIDDMLINDKNESLVKMMLSLAKSLGLEVVAEGIETKDQAEFLRQQECHTGQGYYFAKPMLIKEFEGYLFSQQKNK